MRQLKTLSCAVLAMSLAACSNPQFLLNPSSSPTVSQARQGMDNFVDSLSVKPLVWGSFVSPAKGVFFRPTLSTDSRNALIYVYRLESSWNDAEIQSPGFFINGEFISGLKSGSYFWFEVPASTYYFSARRPLGPAYISTIFETDVTFEGGQRYYFRYNEEKPGPKKAAKGAPLLVIGPLQQTPESQALQEIGQTRSMGVGKVLMADPQPQWAPFDFYPNAQPVQEASLDADLGQPQDVNVEEQPAGSRAAPAANVAPVKTERHWWNPATWR